MNGFMEHFDRLHTTEMGKERIKRNLNLETDDVVQWCKAQISEDVVIKRIGKNWYAETHDCRITVNAYSYTIITAHKVKKSAE